MVTGFMCHEDSESAVERGLEGFHFFGYALAHYYITGTHVPGRLQRLGGLPAVTAAHARGPTGGIGNPDEIRANLEKFEAVGVDQVIFIQQGGNNRHEHICSSLELFAERVLPEFKERHAARARQKAEELAPYIEQAMAHPAAAAVERDEPDRILPGADAAARGTGRRADDRQAARGVRRAVLLKAR